MQEQERRQSPLHRRRSQLPALAPRNAHSSSTRSRPLDPVNGRPPRLSHRSRAGCWTCRGRKVKCDERHPKCGPCTRLGRDCDWDHRWNFSDATISTQSKHSNISTIGNVVWHPRASRSFSPVSRGIDSLPPFLTLTNDEERERKAELQSPGTYGVVVTPRSFADLPEYANSASPESRRMSLQSHSSLLEHSLASLSRTTTQDDPNVVILDRFEDASPTSTAPFAVTPQSRRASAPDLSRTLSLNTAVTSIVELTPPSALSTQTLCSDDKFYRRFRDYVSCRLIQPSFVTLTDALVHGSTRDVFEIEAARFPPLHHAICALSALNLSYNGSIALEEAHSHYEKALNVQNSIANADAILSDGAFFRHFLLIVYDICESMQQDDEGGSGMWAVHLTHLRNLATMRQEDFGRKTHAYLIWVICELDMYACLLGSGEGDFVRTVLQLNMLPSLESTLPSTGHSLTDRPALSEVDDLRDILGLNQGITLRTAEMAQSAQRFRSQAAAWQRGIVSDMHATSWSASATHFERDLEQFWRKSCPEAFADSHYAARALPGRTRYVYERALLLYHAAVIYARTSMFPGQRRLPTARHAAEHADTEQRVTTIVLLATEYFEGQLWDRRHIIFPLFMAGLATSRPDAKIQALDLIKAFEREGIGSNTYKTRKLLGAVYEEQTRLADSGHRMEDVDWIAMAKQLNLTVVNCGL